MKDMKSRASFSQRERNSSIHSIESAPSPTLGGSSFIPPSLKPVTASRQSSLPEAQPFLVIRDRRASETDFLNQSRKNIVGELER